MASKIPTPLRRLPVEKLEDMGYFLTKALDAAGGTTEVAHRFKIRSQAISQWDRCPADKVIALEYYCEHAVTRYQLRPDIFGDGSDACPKCSRG